MPRKKRSRGWGNKAKKGAKDKALAAARDAAAERRRAQAEDKDVQKGKRKALVSDISIEDWDAKVAEKVKHRHPGPRPIKRKFSRATACSTTSATPCWTSSPT